MLDFAHIDITMQHTERQGHAFDIVKDEIQIGQYNAILAVSGDGIIHEIVNGLMARQDRVEFLQSITLGPIPAGTGNALVTSILEGTNEVNELLSSTFKICKGNSIKMDLTQLDLEYRQNEE